MKKEVVVVLDEQEHISFRRSSFYSTRINSMMMWCTILNVCIRSVYKFRSYLYKAKLKQIIIPEQHFNFVPVV